MSYWKYLIQSVPSHSAKQLTIKDYQHIMKGIPLTKEDFQFMIEFAERTLNGGQIEYDHFVEEGGLDILLVMLAKYLNEQEIVVN